MLHVRHFEQGFALGRHFAPFGILRQYRTGNGTDDTAFLQLVFNLPYLYLCGIPFFRHALVAEIQSRQLGFQLLFQHSQLRLHIVHLLLRTGILRQQIQAAFSFQFGLCDLFPSGRHLLGHVRPTATDGTYLGFQLALLQVKLHGIHISHLLPLLQQITFFQIQRHDFTVGFGRYDDFRGFEDSGSVEIRVCPATRRKQSQQGHAANVPGSPFESIHCLSYGDRTVQPAPP